MTHSSSMWNNSLTWQLWTISNMPCWCIKDKPLYRVYSAAVFWVFGHRKLNLKQANFQLYTIGLIRIYTSRCVNSPFLNQFLNTLQIVHVCYFLSIGCVPHVLYEMKEWCTIEEVRLWFCVNTFIRIIYNAILL